MPSLPPDIRGNPTGRFKVEPLESPGFRRLKERLGPERYEALRQDTLRMQEEALGNARQTIAKQPDASEETVRNVIRGKK